MDIGFIGLGRTGKPIATNLLRAGYRLKVRSNREQAAADSLIPLGATLSPSFAQLARDSDVVFVMLPDWPNFQRAILGDEDDDGQAAIAGLRPGSVLVDLGAMPPMETRRTGERLRRLGVAMVDAAVFDGGKPKIRRKFQGFVEGTLFFAVSGDEQAFERIRHLFEAFSSKLEWVGQLGNANFIKLTRHQIISIQLAALSEALVLARKGGVDPEDFLRIYQGGSSNHFSPEATLARMIQRDFDSPGFQLWLQKKEMFIALQTAQELGCALPVSSLLNSLLQSAMNLKGGATESEEDRSSFIRLFETLNQLEQAPAH